MKKTISRNEFIVDMMKCDSSFSWNGAEALYDYLEDLDEDCEVDYIGLRCNFAEYEDIEEFQTYYGEEDYQTIEDIEDVTTVIMGSGKNFIINTEF